mmetsp:Transcript_40999/g.113904  ORF Transcript_40999/g.113904 Transcript_40999/m.113904 type:complete len:264 (-) Transcript_40999:1172-1963(-)
MAVRLWPVKGACVVWSPVPSSPTTSPYPVSGLERTPATAATSLMRTAWATGASARARPRRRICRDFTRSILRMLEPSKRGKRPLTTRQFRVVTASRRCIRQFFRGEPGSSRDGCCVELPWRVAKIAVAVQVAARFGTAIGEATDLKTVRCVATWCRDASPGVWVAVARRPGPARGRPGDRSSDRGTVARVAVASLRTGVCVGSVKPFTPLRWPGRKVVFARLVRSAPFDVKPSVCCGGCGLAPQIRGELHPDHPVLGGGLTGF